MNMHMTVIIALLLTVSLGAVAEAPEKTKVALLTGGHGFEKEPFLKVFNENDAIEYDHIQLKEGGEAFEDISEWDYDVIVMYNMSPKISEKQQQNLITLLERGVGLVSTHHAIANYPEWPEYNEIIGARYFLKDQEWRGKECKRSEYTHDVDMPITVTDKNHPITKGLKDFVIHDETYHKWAPYEGSHLLLTTDHPKSNKEICWTRTYKNARVVFLQLGHDSKAYVNPSYQEVLARSIQWVVKS